MMDDACYQLLAAAHHLRAVRKSMLKSTIASINDSLGRAMTRIVDSRRDANCRKQARRAAYKVIREAIAGTEHVLWTLEHND